MITGTNVCRPLDPKSGSKHQFRQWFANSESRVRETNIITFRFELLSLLFLLLFLLFLLSSFDPLFPPLYLLLLHLILIHLHLVVVVVVFVVVFPTVSLLPPLHFHQFISFFFFFLFIHVPQ